MWYRILKIILSLSLLLCSLTCCAPQPEVGTGEPDVRLVWPPAPQEAKIEWVKEISILENAGETGFWQRVREFFVGRELNRVLRPYGVATDQAERLFIADTGASRVPVYDMQQNRYFAIKGDEKTQLQSPIGVTYAVNGILYITDSVQGAVLRYSFEDQQLKRLTPYMLQRPTGIAFSWRSKQLYVVDTKAHEVVVLDLNGAEQFRFGGRGDADGRFNYPTDIWVDLQGQVYITDALNSRVQIFTAEGGFINKFGRPGDSPGDFAKPKGIAVDPAGHIYVCDSLFDAVQIFSQDGRLLMAFGDNGTQPGQFWMPSGIFADRKGFIYVTDTYNQRIQVFKHKNCTNTHDCSKLGAL